MAQLKWQLIFLAFLLIFKNTKAESKATQRIINGAHAIPKQFPYQVYIESLQEYEFQPLCGGAIISKRTILTAAHCISNDWDLYKVYFGATDVSNNLEKGQQSLVIKRKNIVVHPEWDSIPIVNDIALIRLPADLQFDEYIQPAKLPNPNETYDNENAIISGWGRTSGDSDLLSQQLLYSNATVLSNKECKSIVEKYRPGKFFTSSWICTRPSRGLTCNGDSGGPLAIRNEDGSSTLLGVTSFGMDAKCTVNRPDVFTRVSSFLSWITNVRL